MQFSVVYEKVSDPSFEGYYYAHIPSLSLTTHGLGIEGAKEAAPEAAAEEGAQAAPEEKKPAEEKKSE